MATFKIFRTIYQKARYYTSHALMVVTVSLNHLKSFYKQSFEFFIIPNASLFCGQHHYIHLLHNAFCNIIYKNRRKIVFKHTLMSFKRELGFMYLLEYLYQFISHPCENTKNVISIERFKLRCRTYGYTNFSLRLYLAGKVLHGYYCIYVHTTNELVLFLDQWKINKKLQQEKKRTFYVMYLRR